ncbi:MAG: class IV adenylate cyclase [Candidatus Asgardarchaeia archaeon]
MYEIEVKIKLDEEEILRIKKSIEKLGFKKIYEGFHHDFYFKHPCRDFKKRDEALRVRILNDDRCVVSYKGPRMRGDEFKVREEINTYADVNVKELLMKLGFTQIAELKKFREVYKKEGVSLSIDDVEGLGRYIEIETLTKESDFRDPREKINDLIEKLGLKRKNIIRKTYLEMVLKDP